MIQEVVGLGFQSIRADGDNGVGKFGVFVAIVQLANAHIARAMNFRIVCGAIMDADVLYLHGFEIELASAPGVFVAATGAAVIERRDEEAVFALFGDHGSSHSGN